MELRRQLSDVKRLVSSALEPPCNDTLNELRAKIARSAGMNTAQAITKSDDSVHHPADCVIVLE
jgi:hypothetical protein